MGWAILQQGTTGATPCRLRAGRHYLFAQTTERAAHDQWCTVTEQLRERFQKITKLIDEAQDEVLAHVSFPTEHRTKIHSANTLERPNG